MLIPPLWIHECSFRDWDAAAAMADCPTNQMSGPLEVLDNTYLECKADKKRQEDDWTNWTAISTMPTTRSTRRCAACRHPVHPDRMGCHCETCGDVLCLACHFRGAVCDCFLEQCSRVWFRNHEILYARRLVCTDGGRCQTELRGPKGQQGVALKP